MLGQQVWLIFLLICVKNCFTLTRCPDDWTFNSNTSSCYYYTNDSYEYQDSYAAEKMCKKHHQQSDLVMVDSLEELQMIQDNAEYLSSVWLRGLTNYSLDGSEIDLTKYDPSTIGDGDHCLNLSWGHFLVTDYCFSSKRIQLFCELSGTECEVEHDRGLEASSCIDVDCTWSEWSDNCQCSGKDNGTWERSRSLNNYQDQNFTCGDEYQEDECNSECAAKDCSWGEWSASSYKSSYSRSACTCINGYDWNDWKMNGKISGSRKMYRIKEERENEWGSCSGENEKDGDCTYECNSNCKWSDTGPCSCSGFGFSGQKEIRMEEYPSYAVYCPTVRKRYEPCDRMCLPDLDLPDLDGMAVMGAVMFGIMMKMVTYWMAFMLLFGSSLFIFAFFVVFYIMKREIITHRFQESKSHVI